MKCLLMLIAMLLAPGGLYAEKVVATIQSNETSLNRFANKDKTTGEETNHGYQWYARPNIAVKDYKMENLALELDVYVQNKTNAGDLSPFGAPGAIHAVELYNRQNSGTRNWDVRKKLVPGEWNHLQLKLSDAVGRDFNVTDTVKWFRIFFARMTDSNDMDIRIRNVRVVDVSSSDDPSADDDKLPYLVGQICSKAQLNSNYDAGNDWYGYQWYNRELNIDASAHKLENLALDFDVYMENLDTPGDIANIMGQSDMVDLLELGNEQYNQPGLTWGIKNLVKQEGWNHVTVKLSEGRGSQFSKDKAIKWFRFCLAHVKTKDAYIIRLRNVNLIDLTGKKSENGDKPKTYDTDYHVCDIPYTMEQNLTFAEGKDVGFVASKLFAPIDVANHDVKKCYLQFDADLSFTGGAEVSKLGTNGQIELTSSGHSDVNEAMVGIGTPEWKVGKNTYTIPLVTFSNSGGSIDWSSLNFMRIYWVHMPCYEGTMHLKVDNVKIVDYSTKTSLPTIFSDGMMFQQKKPINIWGYATGDKRISVEFFKGDTSLGTQTTTPEPTTGKWNVTFPALNASYEKCHFTVKEDGNPIHTVNDILIGEVWVAAGQSNMALSVAVTIDAEDIRTNATNDNIRFFMEPTKPTVNESPYEPTKDISGASWGYGTNGSQVNGVSAVCYSMVKTLQQKLNIPVGFINTPIGGSVIEAWIPRREIESDRELVGKLKRIGMYFDKDFWVDGATTLTGFYNAKIGPLQGYNIAGVIWYQGESNSGRAELYTSELNLLKKGWERTFGFEEGTMPFIFTQVAPWPTNLDLPQFLTKLAESMYDAWKLNEDKKMSMITIYDTDLQYGIKINNNADPIHPTNKTPIGKRFAKVAYNMVYGSGEYTAPVFESATANGDTLVVKFTHVGDGLKTKDGNDAVHGFAVAGSDGAYAGAEARISGKDVVKVWNPAVKSPVRVTYAWATYNVASNLMNSEDIPAALFRSSRDDGQTYYNPQDWTYCDSVNVWAVDERNNTEYYKKQVGWLPSWKTTTIGAAISFPTDIKAEGRASLKADYPAGGGSFGPEMRYQNRVPQLKNFNSLLVSVRNDDARQKTLQLYVNGEQVGSGATVSAASGFRTIAFDISNLVNEATSIEFKVIDTEAGSLYLDNILFGTSEAESITTGINSSVGKASAFADASACYTLSAIKVAKPTQGIYIKGNRKIIVK